MQEAESKGRKDALSPELARKVHELWEQLEQDILQGLLDRPEEGEDRIGPLTPSGHFYSREARAESYTV